MGRPDPLSRLAPSVAAHLLIPLLMAGMLLAGCAAAGQVTAVPRSMPGAGQRASPGPAREGARAPSQVDRYPPARLILPGRVRAEVVPVATVDGELSVPKHVDELGWWDGSAWLGDPYGATVIAGHVDSATEGLGLLAQLLRIRVGDRVSAVGSNGQRHTYQVTSVRTIAQNALADDGRALDQTGGHRLVLITCTGAYTPGQGYDSNLVVTARRIHG